MTSFSLIYLLVAQRSLYAQHIMPNSNEQESTAAYNSRKQMINIESTVTPIRRHQSIQGTPSSSGQMRSSRPFPVPGGFQTTSLDLPNPPPISPMVANQGTPHITSYQQKLLQLQLLHNSNNVDYIRNNGSDTNDYQVYGSNYYGYSSMRSNLKSAASEFSFIRPYSANRNQSTLPHQHHQQQLLHLQQNALDNSNNQHGNVHPMRTSFNASSKGAANVQVVGDSNNNCLSPLTKQFLVNPVTGERIINQGAFVHGDPVPIPPMRELPLKPNKKRQTQNPSSNGAIGDDLNSGSNLPKSSSLTSSIACFFRRAFSRRSKKGSKRQRSRLAESCSSSLGAFEDGVTVVPVVPSAFSTGSKSVDGHINNNKDFNNNNSHQQTVQQQSQRMVDMIEAFTNNRGLANPAYIEQAAMVQSDAIRSQQYSAFNVDFNAAPRLPAAPPLPSTPNQLRRNVNHFGSPMHKSNSICATMGLSLVNNNNNNINNHRRVFPQDNGLMGPGSEKSESPMLMRSTKVMSAHLTPLMLQRDPIDPNAGPNHQFILSPRNSKLDQMPRPSSIYGQPSMISSPIMSRDERNNFGAHRNSLHNHQFRDNTNNISSNAASGFEMRRYNQMMKAPFLDTTREVAEELASPNAEVPNDLDQARAQAMADNRSPQTGRYFIKRDYTFDVINGSPSMRQHHQAAVVNPILQSPTMDTIYDNHPMLKTAELSTYSHYDNHQVQSPSTAQRLPSNSMSSLKTQFIIRQQTQTDDQPSSLEDQYSGRRLMGAKPQSYTPSRQSRLIDASERLPTVADMMMSNKKPSAIVAPSNPNHATQIGIRSDSNLMNDQHLNRMHNPQSPLIQSQSRSPMMSRRAHPQQSHYQQSPLVSQQNRVLSKGDGTQATIIGNSGDPNRHQIGQTAVSIAGAPGINLEPSLAASLLRGTNIDAYETATFDRGPACDEPNTKTFLVSTRLSKSIASSQSSYNHNGSASSILKDEQQSTTSTANSEGSSAKKLAKDDELSAASSSSRSASSSSAGRRSLRAKKGYGSNQEDQLEYSSGAETRGSKGSASNNNKEKYSSSKTRSNGYNPGSSMRCEKRSSSEQSEGTSSSQRSSIDKEVDERNWITSKLVE